MIDTDMREDGGYNTNKQKSLETKGGSLVGERLRFSKPKLKLKFKPIFKAILDSYGSRRTKKKKKQLSLHSDKQ